MKEEGARRGKALLRPIHYQTLRSVSDNHLFVVCRDGGFYELPDDVRPRGPWQGMHRGEITALNPDYWLDLVEQDYALVRCELAVFKPEA